MSQTDTGNSSPSLTPAQIATAGQNASLGGLTFFNGGGLGTAAPSTGGGTGSPILSQDTSGFSQYSINQISGNPVQVGNIPGLTGATTIGQAIQDFMDLPPGELQTLEMQLHDAGFYVDGNGQPIPATDIHFGVPGDPASWEAFTRALSAASSSGVSVSNLLQGRAQMGAGVNNSLPSPVTGGGNTYTIDLSNPTTVKYVADQVFQSALGRNATAAEVSDVTDKLRSQQTQQGLAQQAAHEQQSKATYGAQVNQRNIAYENVTNPNLAGQIPTGPFNNPAQWATALLTYMNMPVTTSNVAALSAWAQKTGKFSDGSFNPLDTSRPEGGSTTGAGGSQQFQNWAQGLQATASMLMDGKYSGLVNALQGGNASDAVKKDATVKQELNTWSDGSFSSLSPDANTTQQAAEAAFYWKNSQQQQTATDPSRLPMGMNRNNAQIVGADQQTPDQAVQATLQAGATNPQVGAYLQAQQQQAIQNTLQAGATNPAVGAYLTAMAQQGGQSTVSPANVSQGQQPPNPGDAYINPVTVYSTNPATEESQAYQEATTGANRIPFAGNEYLKAYNAILSMIKAGGPTG